MVKGLGLSRRMGWAPSTSESVTIFVATDCPMASVTSGLRGRLVGSKVTGGTRCKKPAHHEPQFWPRDTAGPAHTRRISASVRCIPGAHERSADGRGGPNLPGGRAASAPSSIFTGVGPATQAKQTAQASDVGVDRNPFISSKRITEYDIRGLAPTPGSVRSSSMVRGISPP